MNWFMQMRPFAWRSIKRVVTRPHLYLPSFIMAVLGLAVNTGSLGSADQLPGFPAKNFVSFSLATGIIMGSLFAPLLVGTDLAADMHGGFLSRVSLAPIKRWALLLGDLCGIGLMGFCLGAGTLAVGLLMGATFEAGVVGVAVLLALTTLTTMALGSIGALIALKTGSAEAVAGVFALSFALVFFSTGTMPRTLILADWFRVIADLNPISSLIEGARSLIVTGWDMKPLAVSFAIVVSVLVAGVVLSARALEDRFN